MKFVSKLSIHEILFSVIAAAVLCLAAPADAADSVKVQRSIPFAATAQVPAAVRDQCQLQTKTPEFISQSAGGSVELIDGALNRNVGRALDLEITEVHSPGGGAFSGPKWMTVKGVLYDRGREIGSFRAKRYSTGGAFAAFKGTCAIIGRCTKALGQDIATWLASPTANAEIGDAR